MSISLNFELNDRDLEHFHEAMARTKKAAEGKSEGEILDCALKLLSDAKKVRIPDFIQERLLRLDDMIAMVRDEGWAMQQADKDRVLSALVYFCDPDDVIPDHVQVLGFLDDAVMIELSVRELKHEIDAYDDFCDFRQHQAERRGLQPDKVGRADWLSSRREELVERMHDRRERDMGVGYGSSSGYGAARSYTRTWRPGLFTFR
ncbi:YkvA family protein [Cognatiluteimonas profundi]|uniref:YkvA family protein n=1 Tax=Cognatiluteimonas profundi TaxID=2594501 RepID=UPI00131C6F65|nr:YkvA family protein [Lysobacter profundi]